MQKSLERMFTTHHTAMTLKVNVLENIGKCIFFDVDIKNGVRFMESDALKAGNKVTVFDTVYGKVGVAICFDMRFPELMRLMALEGAQMIIVPAAFNTTTGPAHWHETIKMRAVDNQVYFIAASPARNKKANYQAYGYSTICDPWGSVLSTTDENESFVTAKIDTRKVEEIRQQLPLLKLRRVDLYDVVKK